MFLLLSELDIAARTIACEAAETFEDFCSIANVLNNRWNRTDGQFARDDTLATTCLRHVQFSVWNKGDPNFRKLYDLQASDKRYLMALRAICGVVDGSIPDRTGGATHYHTAARPSWAAQWPPIWAVGHVPSAEQGGHYFYNDIK